MVSAMALSQVDNDKTNINDSTVDLGGILWDLLDKSKYDEAINEIQKPVHTKYIQDYCMELVPTIMLKWQSEHEDDEECIQCFEDLLSYVAQNAVIKEVILAILGEIDTFQSVKAFGMILKPLQVALMREVSVNCRPRHFLSCFNALIEYTEKLELPSGYNLEGKERKLLDNDKNVQKLLYVLEKLLDFFHAIFEQILLAKLKFSLPVADSKSFLGYTMLRLFNRPLLYLDIYKEETNDENSLFRVTKKYIHMIVRLMGDPVLLFNKIDYKNSYISNDIKKEDSVEDEAVGCDVKSFENIDQGCLSTFFYCVFSQHMSIGAVPCVYSSIYKFTSLLPLLCFLLSKEEHLAIHKGLLLTKCTIENIQKKTLNSDILDAPLHYHFNKVLVECMIRTENKELRIMSLNVFKRYLENFTLGGSYRLFEYLLQTVNHSGFTGLIITEIKEKFLSQHQEEWKENINQSSSHSFEGKSLWRIINIACSLPSGERTDMLDYSDKILSALNLLIFIFTRGRLAISNKSMCQSDSCFLKEELPDRVKELQDNFLEPLHRGLGISQEHYKLKFRELESGVNTDDVEMDVHASGSMLPGMSPEQEKDVMSLALTRFDMMLCVLSQVHTASQELLGVCKE